MKCTVRWVDVGRHDSVCILISKLRSEFIYFLCVLLSPVLVVLG